MYARITSIAHYLPQQRIDNQYFEERLDTTDEWITSRTGIAERRRATPDEATSDLIVPAARACLERRGLTPLDIDCIVVATMTPDKPAPSTASIVQRKLGAYNAWGFDLAAACSGFVFGLATAQSLIASGTSQRLLFCCGEKMSAIVDDNDRSTAVLFGDGAGVLLLEPTSTRRHAVLDVELAMDGFGEPNLHIPSGGSASPADVNSVLTGEHYLRQNGPKLFRAAVAGMSVATSAMMRRNKLSHHDIDVFVPHQANMRIIEAVADRLSFPREKIATNLQHTGNTAAASIPICLSQLDAAGKLHPGDRVLISSFGAGYTMGSIYVRWGVKSTTYRASTTRISERNGSTIRKPKLLSSNINRQHESK